MDSKKYAQLTPAEKYNVYVLHAIAVNRQIRKCVGCVYLSLSGYPSCNYILMAGKRRPCPAGDGCTVKKKKESIEPG